MFVSRLCVIVALLVVWLGVVDRGRAQQPPREQQPPQRRGGFSEGQVAPREGEVVRPPDGPPPGRRGDGPPFIAPFGGPRGEGPYDGPPHNGPPRPPFGQQHELRRMEELKELDPEMYELEKADREMERQTLELSEQCRRAPQDKREALHAKLAQAVSDHFDVRQSRRELHLKRLAEELDKLRATIERRREVRDQIIGKRVAELLGEEGDLAF